MPETLEKLRPDRDLQCYFFRPSAIAAFSNTSASGFTVSGTWREQFDWAVVEWNRDNVFEHPALRNLPDGDLSGLVLTYEETRTNCIPIDSNLYPTVDWPTLRVWAGDNGSEQIYYVPLYDPALATPIEGSFQCAYADFTLSGTATGGDYIGLAFLTEHHTYQLYGSDSLASAAQAVTDSINAFSSLLKAQRTGTTIRVFYTGGTSIEASTAGANGNRFGLYSYTSGSGSMSWDAVYKTFANGTSPVKWRIQIDFSNLHDRDTVLIPTNKIRKLRWTYAADLQADAFARGEFQVVVSNWTVTGTGRAYQVAGPQSRRFEENDPAVTFTGSWSTERGNYSGGMLRRTTSPGDSVSCMYTASGTHQLYLGTRYTAVGATASITVDGVVLPSLQLSLPGEDVLVRWPLGQYGAGSHTVVATHSGAPGSELFLDFFEAAVPGDELPVYPAESRMTLATDWDTDHSLAIAPERTAWLIDTLGFHGRHNYYVGALWFYELVRDGHQYASATVTFSGTPDASSIVTLRIGRDDQPSSSDVVLDKLVHVGLDTGRLAEVFALEINRGYTAIRAAASGGTLTIYARQMGVEGNHVTIAASTTGSNLTITVSGSQLAGGVDGQWITDVAATPRINRACRDWSRSFLSALHAAGIDAVAAFSTELQHGDTSLTAGIVQRGPSGDPILLPTPAVQTNFSPASLDFWKQVHADMAGIQAEAGLQPYLQFGEVQWWYLPNDGLSTAFSGMPFYDAWTSAEFQTRYGRALPVFTTNTADPAAYPDEVAFLASLIGEFTGAIVAYVRSSYSTARFEVLYPTDVNQTAFNRAINYPASAWTPAALDNLKTESFGFTYNRNLDQSEATIDFGVALGFPAAQRSHLVGIGDATAPWLKEARMAQGKGFESVVLFALDQFCLIGHAAPLPQLARRSARFGAR